MTEDGEVARIVEGLTKAQREECERLALEGGWPDDLYFGLLGLAVRAHLQSKGGDA